MRFHSLKKPMKVQRCMLCSCLFWKAILELLFKGMLTMSWRYAWKVEILLWKNSKGATCFSWLLDRTPLMSSPMQSRLWRVIRRHFVTAKGRRCQTC
nr:hypothetical protein Iba_scaffold23191CG0080 [Ipomoea batatas]